MIALSMSYENFTPNRLRKAAFSKHAATRSQQRGIPKMAAPLIKAYGQQEFDGHGGIRYLLTSSVVADLKRLLGHSQQLDALTGAYVVISADNGDVITVGHRCP